MDTLLLLFPLVETLSDVLIVTEIVYNVLSPRRSLNRNVALTVLILHKNTGAGDFMKLRSLLQYI
jgi:hypothetical protein